MSDDGRIARSVPSLTGMLGWNSVAVFDAGGNVTDDGTVYATKERTYVVMTDPYPEYKQFVFLMDEFHYSGDLLRMEYEGVFEDFLEVHGSARIVPLDTVDFIKRDERGIPQYHDRQAEAHDR